MQRNYGFIIIMFFLLSCSLKQKNDAVDEDKLGFIEADVKSEETHFKNKAEYHPNNPGTGEKIARSFENAPPLIPHTTTGFFPITMKNNICLSCHMPDKAKETGAVPLPGTHFTNLRPRLVKVDGIYQTPERGEVVVKNTDTLHNAYFNCSQCHVPQTSVSVNIENLFTPEFREKYGIEKSDLKDKLQEGIK